MNTTFQLSPTTRRQAFTLVEAIIVIAIMGIMSSLIVSAVTNAAKDTRRVMVRQQQSALQSAIYAWVGGQSRDTTTGQVMGASAVQGIWNAGGMSNFARLQLVDDYLDAATASDFVLGSTSNGDHIQTTAMKEDGSYLELPAWATGTGPTIILHLPTP